MEQIKMIQVVSQELASKLLRELGLDSNAVSKIYLDWLKGDYMVDRHFVTDESFENELCEMLKVAFRIFDGRNGVAR
jgi:hypothetical protein